MLDEIIKNCPNANEVFEKEPGNLVYYLLGRRIPLWDEKEMLCL